MTLSVAFEHAFRDRAFSIAFEAPVPGVIALFGPSGSGKTTVLNAIAGLLRPRRLEVSLGGQALHTLPAARRRIGYVFQDGRLFGHLNVKRNLQYGLARAPKGRIPADDVVALLGLERLLERQPHTLSGGERQRVAIGRALLSQPVLLLMDEPLSALDQARRDEILPYLARLRTAFALPIVYASHAVDEVMRLADTLVLIESGRLVAAGPLAELATRVDLPLAARDDASGLLHGKLYAHMPERRLSAVACGGNILLVPRIDAVEGSALRLRVPAREVILAEHEPRGISVSNILPATVAAMALSPSAPMAMVELDLDGGGTLLSRITFDAAQRLNLRQGAKILALIKAVSVELGPH